MLVQALVYMATFYPTCGYSPTPWRVAWFFAFSFLYMLFSTAFGQAVGAFCPSVQVAQIALNCILPIFSMMSGMTIIPIDLPTVWKPLWVITPFNKAFEGLVMTQWGLDASGQIGFFDLRAKTFLTLSKGAFVEVSDTRWTHAHTASATPPWIHSPSISTHTPGLLRYLQVRGPLARLLRALRLHFRLQRGLLPFAQVPQARESVA